MDVSAVAPRLTNGNVNSPAAPKPDEMAAACKSFEAYFTASLLSSLSKTTETGAGAARPSQEKQLAWSVLTQAVAEKMAESQSLGLSRQLLEDWALKTGQNPGAAAGAVVQKAK